MSAVSLAPGRLSSGVTLRPIKGCTRSSEKRLLVPKVSLSVSVSLPSSTLAFPRRLKKGEVIKDGALRAPVLIIKKRDANQIVALLRADQHEAPRLRVGKRPQEKGINHAEDRSVGADARGQRQRHDQCEARPFEQRA